MEIMEIIGNDIYILPLSQADIQEFINVISLNLLINDNELVYIGCDMWYLYTGNNGRWKKLDDIGVMEFIINSSICESIDSIILDELKIKFFNIKFSSQMNKNRDLIGFKDCIFDIKNNLQIPYSKECKISLSSGLKCDDIFVDYMNGQMYILTNFLKSICYNYGELMDTLSLKETNTSSIYYWIGNMDLINKLINVLKISLGDYYLDLDCEPISTLRQEEIAIAVPIGNGDNEGKIEDIIPIRISTTENEYKDNQDIYPDIAEENTGDGDGEEGGDGEGGDGEGGEGGGGGGGEGSGIFEAYITKYSELLYGKDNSLREYKLLHFYNNKMIICGTIELNENKTFYKNKKNIIMFRDISLPFFSLHKESKENKEKFLAGALLRFLIRNK